MSFPTIESVTEFNGDSSYSANWTLPSLSGNSGDILLWIISTYSGSRQFTGNSSGWTLMDPKSGVAVTGSRGVVFYRVLSSSESHDLNFTLSSSVRVAAAGFRISGSSGEVYFACDAPGYGVNDPPSLNTGSTKDWLWMATYHIANSSYVPTTPPTNYTDMITISSSSSCIATARRFLRAQTEDPGSFTGADTYYNVSSTLAISGIEGGGDVTSPTITSANTTSVAENETLSYNLTADETVTWSIVGGADSAEFQISGSTLQWSGNTTKDFEIPTDSNIDNEYVVIVRATDTATNTSDQTITVTVTDVYEDTGGTTTMGDLIYDVEDQIMPFTIGDTAQFTVTSGAAKNGSYGIECRGSESYCAVVNTSKSYNLNSDFKMGAWVRWDGASSGGGAPDFEAPGIIFGAQSSSQYFIALIDERDGSVQIRRDFNNNYRSDGTTISGKSRNTWYWLEVTSDDSNNHTAKVYDAPNGTELATVTRNDSSYTSGGVGIGIFGEGSIDDVTVFGVVPVENNTRSTRSTYWL